MEGGGGNEKRKSDASAAESNNSKKGSSGKRATNAGNEATDKSQEKRKTNIVASNKRKSIGEGSDKTKAEDSELPSSLPQKSIAYEGKKSIQRKSGGGEDENDSGVHPAKSISGAIGRKSQKRSLGGGSEEAELGAADSTRPPQKSVAAEPEYKPLFRITNPNIRTSPPKNIEDAEDDGNEQRRGSRSSITNKDLKKRRETRTSGEEGESEQSEEDRSILGDANVPLESLEEFVEGFGPKSFYVLKKRELLVKATFCFSVEPEAEIVEVEKSRGSMLKDKWQGISQFIRRTFDEPSRVFKLRGYHSEPNLSLPFEDKFDTKIPTEEGDFPKTPKKFVSCEDIVFCTGNEHPNLVRGVLSEIKLRSYAIDDKAKTEWQEVVELEKKRFSFFDELFAMGYVVDSLEVLSNPPKGEDGKIPQGEYFVEAEEKHYRKKVDYGRVVFKTKHVYTGNFLDWYFEGPGRYSWQDGTIYQGEFSHGLMHGPGSIHWPDGCVYEGHFINGIRTGWGVYSTADGYTFAGEWFKGLPHGYGKMWYDPEDDENDYYEGQWEKGLPQGVGTRQYSTGDRYVGNWSRGLRNGYGIMIWLQERQVYKGDWLDGVPHGFGKHIWYLERSTSNPFPSRHVYQGAWILGRREGIGKMIYPCGSVYEGRWKNGQRHGKGMFINPAGDILVGLFRAGSILGGSDVPLHAPTYDCDYGGLTEWLTAKFSLNLEDNFDDESLHEITRLYLPYIRKLYHRAGEYSQKYGNHGLYPAYMKKTNTAKSHPNEGKHHDHYGHHNTDPEESHPHHRGYSRLDEPQHMKGKVEKPDALDGVNPVTRFGLWLVYS
ncbi:Radial spoke head 10 B [Orchesella cincta]|uniref:Radial spoke head 10 B n=1 Tax=Orchesella cincta TaxID=48709 RepID=A0A1D2NHL3_ORCCI|nr:Radial spoke head 10 B [Orchesella cincta]